MKKVISLLLVVCMLGAVAISLTACGEPKDDGARIDVYLGNGIHDFDPTDYYVDSNAEQVMSLLFEPLFRCINGRVKCAMAEDYEVNEEDRTIVITLRESYWSNSARVKASDFVYAWSERLLDPSNPNPAAALLYDIENALELKCGEATPADLMVEATDVYELTITYREGADYKQLLKNLSSVATSPIRPIEDASTVGYWSKSLATIVTNGPFRLSAYDALGAGFTLARNKGYHQPYDEKDYDNEVNPGQLVAVTTPFGEQIQLSYEDIEQKTCFYLSDAPLADRSEYLKKATIEDDTSVYTYVFNTNNPLFKDANVRLALSMAIDREAIADAITFGKAADGFVPDVSGGAEDEIISTKADIEAARQKLAAADLTGIEKKFKLTIADDAQSIAIADIVVAAWSQLGFEVEVEKLGTVSTQIGEEEDAITIYDSAIQRAVKLASVGVTEFDVIAVDWQTYTNDAFVALASLTSDMNGCGRVLPAGEQRLSISGWADAGYDALVKAAYDATDEERDEYLVDAERRLCESMPVMPIVFNQNGAFVSKSLKKLDYDSFGNVIFTDAKQRRYKDYLEDSED